MSAKHKKFGFRKVVSGGILLVFLTGQIFTSTIAQAQALPLPRTSIGLTAGFQPPVLLGLKIHPENPLLFDFIVDQGAAQLSQDELKSETEKLVKYFLAALTIPDKEVWVNLSPYEKDRIIPDMLGQTVMGKTMLEQDYLLKQLASSLTNPDEKLGAVYWNMVKAKAGHTEVEASTLSKVWIVPQKAEVLESNGIVLVGDKRLKVMMADDYEAARMSSPQSTSNPSVVAHAVSHAGTSEVTQSISTKEIAAPPFEARNDATSISSSVFRSTILPIIEKEVNEGKNFANVRQIYNSVILAAWYKKALKESLLGKVYADKSKVAGIETDDKQMKQRIYEQYIEAFKKGAYNLIKEEADSSGEMIPKKYFSGGAMLGLGKGPRTILRETKASSATIDGKIPKSTAVIVRVLATEKDEAGMALKGLSDIVLLGHMHGRESHAKRFFDYYFQMTRSSGEEKGYYAAQASRALEDFLYERKDLLVSLRSDVETIKEQLAQNPGIKKIAVEASPDVLRKYLSDCVWLRQMLLGDFKDYHLIPNLERKVDELVLHTYGPVLYLYEMKDPSLNGIEIIGVDNEEYKEQGEIASDQFNRAWRNLRNDIIRKVDQQTFTSIESVFDTFVPNFIIPTPGLEISLKNLFQNAGLQDSIPLLENVINFHRERVKYLMLLRNSWIADRIVKGTLLVIGSHHSKGLEEEFAERGFTFHTIINSQASSAIINISLASPHLKPLTEQQLKHPNITTDDERHKLIAPVLNPGGIDFDSTKMNLQIKRDGKGVPLPLPQQNIESIHLDGLFPVIINIQPVNSQTLPLLLGQAVSKNSNGPQT